MTNALDTSALFKTTMPPHRDPGLETNSWGCGGLLSLKTGSMSSELTQIHGVSRSTDPASHTLVVP
jgi:hypothetical protein